MDTLFAVLEYVPLGLWVLALFDSDFLRVDLLDLLVIKHQIGLENEILVIKGYVSFYSEVDHVVELHFFLIVPQQERLGQE